MDLRSVLRDLQAVFLAEGIDHALIGGLALAAHGAARATVDLDFLADGARADDVHRLLHARGYVAIHRSEHVANYVSEDATRGRVDFLFTRGEYGRAMLARATPHLVLGRTLRVADAADLIGLKIQASSNDPARRRQDMADVEKLLRSAGVDLGRVREYFRLFDRENELDALLAGQTDD